MGPPVGREVKRVEPAARVGLDDPGADGGGLGARGLVVGEAFDAGGVWEVGSDGGGVGGAGRRRGREGESGSGKSC